MKHATLEQAGQVLALMKGLPREQVQALLESGLLSDLLSGDLIKVSRNDLRRVMGLRPLAPQCPPLDEWFTLLVNYAIDPMAMVKADGYDPTGWEYIGPKFTGTAALHCKRICFGSVKNRDEAETKAKQLGYAGLAPIQAREAFRAKYPKPGVYDRIAFGGSLGRYPNGNPNLAYLDELTDTWLSYFRWADGEFNDSWSWVVVGK